MDRINGADTVDIGGGRRGFRDEDLLTGQIGTEVTAAWLNMVQEEIGKVIEGAGLTLDPSDWTQLWQALQAMGLSFSARSRRWTAITSMTTTAPPASPAQGDAYLVPTGATGVWAANAGRIAEWIDGAWSYTTPVDGHGVCLPDGRVFERIGGAYTEFLASRSWVNSRTVASTKLNRLPWLPVTSMTTTAPPASPAQGATYLIPAGATGAWSSNVGRIAEWIDGAWSYTTPVDGHAVCAPNGAVFIRIGAQYLPFAASAADALAGASSLLYISPATLAALLDARFGNSSRLFASANPVFPEVENATGRMTINVTGASIVVATGQTWMHRGIFRYSTDSYTLAQRTFPVAANSEYHLRWTPSQGFSLRSLNDTSYNPGAVAGFFEVFDTSYDDMLVATISVGASTSAITVTPLANRARLQARATMTGTASVLTTGNGNDGVRVSASLTLHWSRNPFYNISGWAANTGARELHGYANRVSVALATRHVLSAYIDSDFNGVIDGTAHGEVQFSAFA